MPVSRRIYFDANVLLAFVGNEENRADMVQTLLDEARRGAADGDWPCIHRRALDEWQEARRG